MPTIKIRKYNDSVYIVYSHKLKIFKIYTGVRIEDNYWYDHAPRKNCPKYDEVTRQIAAMESRVLNASIAVRSQGLDPAVDLVRKEFYNQVTEGQERLPFWKTYMIYLGLLTCRTSTQKKIRSTYNTFKKFCKFSRYEFDVDTFDRIVFGQFIKYQLDNQKYADVTILKHVKQLKAFLKYAYPEKDWSFVRYYQLKVSHEVIALSEEELGVIMHADVIGHLDKTRDLFVFLALTGMRFCDSQRFHLSWITPENILEFNQLKTGGKAYPPLYDATMRVLDKYNGSPPLISQQKFNSYLKELFKKIKLDRTVIVHVVKGKQVYSSVEPLYNVISSHTARRTFITICLEKGMQIQDVMRMSGHSDYASMRPYMRVTRKHIRDVADKWSI